MNKSAEKATLTVRALRTLQGETSVYSLFLAGTDLLKVADIARIARGEDHELQGFQRKEIRDHVNAIASYLDSGNKLFPNAIILALAPEVKFTQSRGPADSELTSNHSQAGKLSIPLRPNGERAAWVVDGQQRSLALSKSANGGLSVPIVAFESASIQTLREQFILVNRARPLPQRLIDELLPDTGVDLFPRDLNARQLPSRLCDALNTVSQSPLRGLIRRSSQTGDPNRVVIDTAIVNMIRRSLNNPNGALAVYRSLGHHASDSNSMLRILIDYWSAVKETFPKAWGKPPADSRLMHSAGIAAMGDLFDRIAARASSKKGLRQFFASQLELIAADCAWTGGQWPLIDRSWDEIESTPRDVKMLSQVLVQLYADRSMR